MAGKKTKKLKTIEEVLLNPEMMSEEESHALALLVFAKELNPAINDSEAFNHCVGFLRDDMMDPEAAAYWGSMVASTAYEPEPGVH